MQRFMVESEVLMWISIIDTPAIFCGEEQVNQHLGYDLTGVMKWFAERVHRIIFLFDPDNGFNISDTFLRCVEALKDYEDKFKIIISNVDMIYTEDHIIQNKHRLINSFGRVIRAPVAPMVSIYSFWPGDMPPKDFVHDDETIFKIYRKALFKDLEQFPKNAALMKVKDFIKRARLAKVHAYIISSLQKEMPLIFWKGSKKLELIDNLDAIYLQLQSQYQISSDEFPELKQMKAKLVNFDFTKFQPFKSELIEMVDQILKTDINKLMDQIVPGHDLPEEELP